MHSTTRFIIQALLAASATAQRTQSIWGQCGGSGYTGLTLCPRTAYCNFGNPWYSQCVPGTADEPLPGVPDSPIVTQTFQTIVTVAPPIGGVPDPIIVTTYVTFLTPSATATPVGPGYTIIDGTTFTIIPRSPVTEFLDARGAAAAPAPTRQPEVILIPVRPREAEPDVDRAPVYDTAITEDAVEEVAVVEVRSPVAEPDVDKAPVFDSPLTDAAEEEAAIEARSPAPEPDVDRAPVYDTPIEAVVDKEASSLETRDVDRAPVYDSPIVEAIEVAAAIEARSPVPEPDVDRAPVYDSPIEAVGLEEEGAVVEARDVDRAPVYDTPIAAADAEDEEKKKAKRDVDREPVYDIPIDATGLIESRSADVDRAPVYDTPITDIHAASSEAEAEAAEALEAVEKRDVDRAPVYDVPLEKPLPVAPIAFVPPSAAQAPTPTVLAKGQYWIRAVTSPNYHKYLQTKIANTADVAILGPSRTAGQFSIQSGQLVEFTGDGSNAPPLYLHVEKPADLSANPPQRTLATWFNTTKNEFGTFSWQGDTLTWTVPEIKRQNAAAWLVCRDQMLFVNTGAYAYQTPAGCSDHTIHYYNDAKAND